ncbi:putative protein C2orf71 -like protein [Labeo rohita]|uniref:Photoreceptor cilium actin regulator n=1 Tax=Labeo rohita TaxID=84645 RepID=A0A498MUQ4_LABRO|nr:putative protein C2orf71 -like protein [Labeo rohita]
MGCSPSRGNGLHGAQGAFRRGRTLLPGTHETQSDDGSSGESCGRDTERDNSTVRNNTSSTSLGRKFSTAEPEGAASAKLGTQEITIDILSQEKERQEEKREACEKKGAKKSKKAPKGVKLNRKKEKERKLFSEEKVDFPETLVKAHQAAYAYLNPSISKYEDLLGLLDHAAQTQISLQPMVAFMVLCYEEINKGLQEIVEEGEMMLKENGAHLAWPCEKKNSSSPNSTKNVTSHTCSEPPPDLLQQLLQYTVQRMRQVGQSVCGIGDTALEEAVDYFSSIIEILDEKLRTKRASESRLMRLLSRIEAASQKKPGPEDSALFSEDSGLGAESESLAGSDRQRQRRESCDSTGTICAASSSPCGSTPVHRGSYRGRLLKTISNSSSLNSTDSTCTIAEKEQRDTESLLGSVFLDEGGGDDVEDGLGPSATLAFSGNSMLSSQGESQCSERTEDLDIDNLPPPPLEVLMDNSFENAQTKDMGENVTCRGRSTLRKRTAMSQRLRASLQSVTVLPSKGNLCKSSVSMSPVRSTHQDTRGLVKGGHHDSSYETDTESEEAACLYKQARKIIHLRHSSDSPTEKPTTEQGHRQLSSCQGDIEISQKENNTNETVPNNACKNQTPATPTASRTRVLPSTPLLHRRLPSPPVLKSQASSSTSSSPPVVRKLPTPLSAGQRTLPSTPATRQDHTPITVTGVTYPFKAPSPPASPKVHRWSKENSGEDSSRVFSNARSVFCPVSSSLFEAQPVSTPKPPQAWVSSGSSVLPRPWGERGRLPISARGPQPFIRRSQSDRRPSLSLPSRVPVISVAETCGSEPAISTHGLEDGPVREDKPWNEQTEIRGAIRSVSHPDLCIVGQGLQKEWEK